LASDFDGGKVIVRILRVVCIYNLDSLTPGRANPMIIGHEKLNQTGFIGDDLVPILRQE
jgi:hypothetical protein